MLLIEPCGNLCWKLGCHPATQFGIPFRYSLPPMPGLVWALFTGGQVIKKDQITNKDLLSIFFTVQHTSFMWYSLIFQAKGYDIKCEKSVLRRSCLLVLKWEHYEKKVFKNFFTGATQKKVIFRKKKHQKLLYYNKPLDISGKTTSYLSLGTPEFDICPAIGSQWLSKNDGPFSGGKWVIRPYPLACPWYNLALSVDKFSPTLLVNPSFAKAIYM